MERTDPDATTPTMTSTSAWTITKAEFDGWAAKLRRSGNLMWLGLGVPLTLVGAVLMWTSSKTAMRVLAVGLVAFNAFHLIRNLRNSHRTFAMTDEIWRSGGAVCPRCLRRLGDEPCAHGLTSRDRDALRATWEAGVRGDVTGAIAVNTLIASRRPPRSLGARWNRLRAASVMAVMDPSKPLWKRLLGSILGFGLFMSAMMLAVEFAMHGAPPSPMRAAMTVLQYGIGFGGIMIASLAWSGFGAGRNRCRACGQIVAPGRETLPCPECGADLRAAGAVASGERRRDGRTAAIGAAIGAFAMLAPLALETSILARALPTQALMMQYAVGSPMTRFFIVEEFKRRKLDPATSAAVAELLIAHASPTPGTALDDSDFVGNALRAGAIDAATATRALEATCAIDLDVPERVRVGERFEIRLVPRFGSDLFQLSHSLLIAVAGVEVDGTLLSAPPRWYGRGIAEPDAAERPRPPVFEASIPTPGTHRNRQRAWFVLIPPWVAPTPAQFDEKGTLIAPAMADLVLEVATTRTVVAE